MVFLSAINLLIDLTLGLTELLTMFLSSDSTELSSLLDLVLSFFRFFMLRATWLFFKFHTLLTALKLLSSLLDPVSFKLDIKMMLLVLVSSLLIASAMARECSCLLETESVALPATEFVMSCWMEGSCLREGPNSLSLSPN